MYIWQPLSDSLHIAGFWWLIPGLPRVQLRHSISCIVPPAQRELWWLLVDWLSSSLVAEHYWLGSDILSLIHSKCSLIRSLFLSVFCCCCFKKTVYSTVESFGTVKHYKFIHVQGTVCSMPHRAAKEAKGKYFSFMPMVFILLLPSETYRQCHGEATVTCLTFGISLPRD